MDDKAYLLRTLELAKESVHKGGFPAGAVVVKDGEVIGEGISIGNILHDPTSHAEIVAIRDACRNLNTSDLTGATLYESLQSCVMCLSAANWSGISRIVYTGKKTPEMISKLYYEGISENETINKENTRQIELVYDETLETQTQALVREWESTYSAS